MKKRNSAILQMFYGENGNVLSIKCKPYEGELIDAVEKSYNLLCEKIKDNAELWDLFVKYKDSLEELNFFETDKFYEEGFKFGLLIGVEAGESKFE